MCYTLFPKSVRAPYRTYSRCLQIKHLIISSSILKHHYICICQYTLFTNMMCRTAEAKQADLKRAGVLDTVSQFCSWSTPTGHSKCLPNQTPNYSHQLISIILKGLKWVCQITRETSKMCTIEGPSKNRVGKHSARKSRCASEASRGP